jgi:hypothetical protein
MFLLVLVVFGLPAQALSVCSLTCPGSETCYASGLDALDCISSIPLNTARIRMIVFSDLIDVLGMG